MWISERSYSIIHIKGVGMRVFGFSKSIIRYFGFLDTHPCFQGSGFRVRGVVAASPQIIYGAMPEGGIQVTSH